VVGAYSQSVGYVYDDAGRLLAVVSPSGDAATYQYDANGNLLGIARITSGTLAIFEANPDSAPVGSTITIYGSGFSTTPSLNSVQFNGTSATVTSATSTRLVTSVPVGATSGFISVTVSGNTATSPQAFTVTTTGPPTLTSFTPSIASPGTAISISGTNFDSVLLKNKLRFNGALAQVSSGSTTAMTAPVPNQATSGHLSVTTALGTAVSSADLFVPPSGFTPSSVQYTGRISAGSSQTISLSTAGKIGLLVFDATIFHRISLRFTSVTISGVNVTVYNPDGTAAISTVGVGTVGAFLESPMLYATGTYTVLLQPQSSNTGSLTVNLYDDVDTVTSITPGGSSVGVSISTPGQNAYATFSGTPGQRVSLQITSDTITFSHVSILNPDGTTLVAPTVVNTSGGFLDTAALSLTGTYKILVDGDTYYTGNATLTLNSVPGDFSSTITAGGSPVTVVITTPGQNGAVTFSGTASQRISLRMTSVSITFTHVSIQNPDGSNLVAPTVINTSGGFFDTQTLAQNGTYTIVVNPDNAYTGNMTLTLYSVPADVSGTVSIGGSSVPVTISTPGQNGSLTFSGTSGQQVTVHVTTNTMSTVTVKLLKPDGTTQTSATNSASSFNLSTQTLASTGTYTIVIDPSQANTGSLNISVTSP
jgi:YD repeat-containing protein